MVSVKFDWIIQFHFHIKLFKNKFIGVLYGGTVGV